VGLEACAGPGTGEISSNGKGEGHLAFSKERGKKTFQALNCKKPPKNEEARLTIGVLSI